jgi:hypothetical protein
LAIVGTKAAAIGKARLINFGMLTSAGHAKGAMASRQDQFSPRLAENLSIWLISRNQHIEI